MALRLKSFLGTKQHGIIEFCLLVFSNLAVASSFFGVTLGLFVYLKTVRSHDVL
ncbi:aromatic amino acid transport family protein [Streptococcus agalactiae]|uniref:aromatic amino acid transport family protein n=1 Tax=Streptococcus agalactiae TaxID=1311 RepID=UPI003AF2EB53